MVLGIYDFGSSNAACGVAFGAAQAFSAIGPILLELPTRAFETSSQCVLNFRSTIAIETLISWRADQCFESKKV